MTKFPKDAPKKKVIIAFENLGFDIARVGNHISMIKVNPDGSKIPLTMPNHERIKGSTLRTICRQINISRDEFIRAYKKA